MYTISNVVHKFVSSPLAVCRPNSGAKKTQKKHQIKNMLPMTCYWEKKLKKVNHLKMNIGGKNVHRKCILELY